MLGSPLVTVLMSAYNAERTIRHAIESVLSQNMSEFEFIIIDDGSTDTTAQIVSEYMKNDARIFLHPQKNTGLTRALNTGIKLARGKYIARLDCDDWCYPHRLKTQMQYLEAHDNINLLGSACLDIYPDGSERQWGAMDENSLQKAVYYLTPFPHSSVMMRADTLHMLGGYNENYITSQDTELWIRFARLGRIVMLPEPLIKRYITAESISKKRARRQFYDAMRARLKHKGSSRIKILYYGMKVYLLTIMPDSWVNFLKKAVSHARSS